MAIVIILLQVALIAIGKMAVFAAMCGALMVLKALVCKIFKSITK